jgi:hypothetical protein
MSVAAPAATGMTILMGFPDRPCAGAALDPATHNALTMAIGQTRPMNVPSRFTRPNERVVLHFLGPYLSILRCDVYTGVHPYWTVGVRIRGTVTIAW